MTFEFGDVLVVEFPFTDGSRSKQRPAVVISSVAFNTGRPDVILMAITSQTRPAPSEMEAFLSNWQDAGLVKPSSLKPVVFTLERDRVRLRIGALVPDDIKRLRELLARLIG